METESKQETVRVLVDAEPTVEKLFVYGIFLADYNRARYGMEDPSYDTVKGYLTVGHHIVQAKPTDIEGASLTGLLVSIPTRNFPNLDMLEGGYDRVKVQTTGGFEAYMYVQPQYALENHSTFKYKDEIYEQDYIEEDEEHYPLT